MSKADELSLAEATAAEPDETVPDDLEVRSDAVMVMNGTLQRLRKPALAVAAGVAITLGAIVALGILSRSRSGGVDPVHIPVR